MYDDDDIISNPSEEDQPPSNFLQSLPYNDPFYVPPDVVNRAGRPLPPLPDSRDGSAHYSYHGSLPSHSRGTSEHFGNGSLSLPISRPESDQYAPSNGMSSSKKELNPFAKPFIFGTRPNAVNSGFTTAMTSEIASSTIVDNVQSHSRNPSLGTSHVLNAAAQEFKPGNFTFRPPPGVPAVAFPGHAISSEVARPLPELPKVGSSRAVQGREKRQRTSEPIATSDDDDDGDEESDDEEGRDTMSSFRFPRAPEPTMVFHRSAPTSPTPASSRSIDPLSAVAKPFTFSGFSNMPPVLPPLLGQEQRSLVESILSNGSDFLSVDATRGSGLAEEDRSAELSLPSTQKQKRAPIPLDFKHPVSTNMVPAGLFKNLANGDGEEKIRPARHSGSLEFSEHKSDLSLDDLSVPAISHKITRGKTVNESALEDGFDDASSAPGDHSRQTSMDTPDSPESHGSIIPPDMATFSARLRLEERLEMILDKKFEMLREELHISAPGKFISDSTDELVKEAMAMFRSQLRDSAVKALDDSMADARGELDFEMLRDIIEQGHEDIRKLMQHDLGSIVQSIQESAGFTSQEPNHEVIRSIQELQANIKVSNIQIIDQLSSIEPPSPLANGREREVLILDILSALTPHLAAIRSEPIDYDGLTAQLSQAVKPHISQLIDLASDKRETAELIANRLMPILQTFASASAAVDTESIIAEIATMISRIVSPIDAHVIKEQVADLVVERLDARLTVRDNALNVDNLKNKMAEVISPLLEQHSIIATQIEAIARAQGDASFKTHEMLTGNSEDLKSLSDLSGQLSNVLETVQHVQTMVNLQEQASVSHWQQLEQIQSSVEGFNSSRDSLAEEKQTIVSASERLLNELLPIPNTVSVAVETIEKMHSDILSRVKSMQDMSQEIHRLALTNTELQAQVSKARGAHGQIRVEKDNLNEKLLSTEAERDRLRAEIEKMQTTALNQSTEFVALQAHTTDQEHAMHAALERLKISDVNSQTQQERIAELEKANRELVVENQKLKSRVIHFVVFTG